MATTVAILEAKLLADTRDFDRGMDKSDGKMKGLAKTAGKAGLAGAVLGLGAAVKVGVGEFMEAQRVTAQTEAVLKSTGGAANVTKDEIQGLAEALMRKSGVDDEAIQSGQNMLLTFTKIRNEAGAGNDVFNQATKATLDLSVAMGKDMQSSAILVGKALNDPIKGMSALSRAGIQFTEEQKKMVKEMVASGDTMGAQKLILKELETQFGGSAEAAGKTFSGQINIAKQVLSNFAGEMVSKAIPVIQEMIVVVQRHWPEIRRVIEEVMVRVREVVHGVLSNLRQLWAQWGDEITAIVNRVFPVIESTIRNVLKVIKGVVDVWMGVFTGDWSRAWNGVKAIFTGIWDQLGNLAGLALDAVIAAVKLAVKGAKEAALALGTAIKDAIVDGITGVGNAAWNVINNIWEFVSDRAKTVKGWGESIGGWVKDGIVDGLKGIGTAIWNAIKAAWEWVKEKVKDLSPIDLPDVRLPFSGGRRPEDVFPQGDAHSPDYAGLNLMGASPVMAPFAYAASQYGLQVTSGLRPGAITANGTPSDHGVGKALDVAGSAAAMASFFRSLIGNQMVKQAFYDPLGSIFGGAWSSYREGGHSDHVHVATYDKGGVLRPGWNLAYNGLGRNEALVAMPGGAGLTVNLNGPFYGDERGIRELSRRIRVEWNRVAGRNG